MARFVINAEDDRINVPLLDPLFKDVAKCETMLEKDDSQFARRCFVRASFAFIEAHIHWLRQETLAILLANTPRGEGISVHKIALLADESPKVDERGVLTIDPARLRFSGLVAFVCRTLAEVLALDPVTISPTTAGGN